MTYGTLYGVGVGPGDPELITLKAIRIIASTPRLYAAKSSKNSYSVAHSIVLPHLHGKKIGELAFPMTKDKAVLAKAWTENAQTVLNDLKAGMDVAFLTLGDPMTYSTFGYLLQTIQKTDKEIPVEVVPGITSYCAAAAKSKTVLAESEETLAVLSGACGGDTLRKAVHYADNIVLLKAYKQWDDIFSALEEQAMLDRSVFISNCGQKNEEIKSLPDAKKVTPPYFSLVIGKK